MNGPRDNETGIGLLESAEGRLILNQASYSLTIDHAQIAGGLPYIRGEILNPPDGGFASTEVGDALLRLQDGRQWACTLADTRGTLTPRGQRSPS